MELKLMDDEVGPLPVMFCTQTKSIVQPTLTGRAFPIFTGTTMTQK